MKTQRVQRYYHYRIRPQKTSLMMVLGGYIILCHIGLCCHYNTFYGPSWKKPRSLEARIPCQAAQADKDTLRTREEYFPVTVLILMELRLCASSVLIEVSRLMVAKLASCTS